jgi:ABC-type cobalamin/Fe3+-siderophores transport system ATPase subunit
MIMKNGEVRACGKTSEVVSGRILEEVYEIDVAGYMREALRGWVNQI